jgi:SAM-dependent methyltransferase
VGDGADWYDEALYYDVLFSWDATHERDFVLGASARWGLGAPRRVLEPFCGTGRLLRHMPGLAVGFDLNPHMVRFAARTCRVFRADAARFALAPASFDLAYCLIDSFRHLPHPEAAAAHLRCLAQALRPGALYVLGLDISAGQDADESREEWTGRRGDVEVKGRVELLGDADPATRLETMEVELRVRHGRERRTVVSRQPLRLWSGPELLACLAAEGSFALVASFARTYQLDEPVPLEDIPGSAVLVLRRR